MGSPHMSILFLLYEKRMHMQYLCYFRINGVMNFPLKPQLTSFMIYQAIIHLFVGVNVTLKATEQWIIFVDTELNWRRRYSAIKCHDEDADHDTSSGHIVPTTGKPVFVQPLF